MVVAPGAVEGGSQPDRGHRLGLVEEIVDAVLFCDAASLAIDGVIAQETRGEALFIGGSWKPVSGDLPDGELVEGQVAIEGVDHPVAPRPHGALAIALVSVGIGVAGGFHPFPRHPLAVARGSQQTIHLPLVGLR